LEFIEISALRENKNLRIILVRAFVVRWVYQQCEPFLTALAELKKKYKDLGYAISIEFLNNDQVRTALKWTVTELFDWLLAADVHLVPTHIHQGNVGKGGSDTWNTNVASHIGPPAKALS
jgi:hypothetical protein